MHALLTHGLVNMVWHGVVYQLKPPKHYYAYLHTSCYTPPKHTHTHLCRKVQLNGAVLPPPVVPTQGVKPGEGGEGGDGLLTPAAPGACCCCYSQGGRPPNHSLDLTISPVLLSASR